MTIHPPPRFWLRQLQADDKAGKSERWNECLKVPPSNLGFT
ncbi:hypothetical protein DEMA109039_03220 [Deinococcus marmoris]